MPFKSILLPFAVIFVTVVALPVRQKRQWAGIAPTTLLTEHRARQDLANSQFLANQATADANYLQRVNQGRQRQDLLNSQIASNQAVRNAVIGGQPGGFGLGRGGWNGGRPFNSWG
ncbi:unnamed protein product [Bursaphelenchus xylophilus]|uniref:(pine wood nematode) hypothetical protein n=1 Tax=Bursaphelenchus xylophilus TaxID=6326 RepID=A0A1I7SCU7_BURXY|nr:unnamed protein product [Bursaphelenchus xylophilus]CAG9093454.1 unnamed protein product [Bursaphelenchus xylophilus]